MQQNVNLGSNGVDRVHLLQKIPTRLRGMNFCTRFGPFCTEFRKAKNDGSLGSNGVDRVRSLQKIPTQLRGMNFCISSACFAPSFVRQQKGPECTQILSNAPNRELRVNGVDQVRSLQKIPTRLHGTNFCTSSACFAPSFVRQPNGLECTQIVRNTPKRQFRVQWGGSGAFVAKKSDDTSWHELLQ